MLHLSVGKDKTSGFCDHIQHDEESNRLATIQANESLTNIPADVSYQTGNGCSLYNHNYSPSYKKDYPLYFKLHINCKKGTTREAAIEALREFSKDYIAKISVLSEKKEKYFEEAYLAHIEVPLDSTQCLKTLKRNDGVFQCEVSSNDETE